MCGLMGFSKPTTNNQKAPRSCDLTIDNIHTCKYTLQTSVSRQSYWPDIKTQMTEKNHNHKQLNRRDSHRNVCQTSPIK